MYEYFSINRLVGSGQLSIVAATEMGRAREREGGLEAATAVKTRRLASCTNESHFHNRVGNTFGSRLQFQTIQLPMLDEDNWDWQTLAPYEVMADMYATSIEQFNLSMFGREDPDTVLPEMWLAHPGHHIHASPHLPLNKTIPLYFHSDGVDIYNSVPFRVYQVSSALAHDIDVEDAKLFAGALDEARCTPETDATLVRWWEWNLEILEDGRHPALNFAKQPWADFRARRAGHLLMGEWRAAFHSWTGDLKEKVYQHHFHRNYMCTFLCENCLCSRDPDTCYAYDFSPTAEWKALRVPYDLYLRVTPLAARSPWCGVRSWTTDRNREDLLHNMWLGWVKDFNGMLLYDSAIERIHANADSLTLDHLESSLAEEWISCVQYFRVQGEYANFSPFTLTTIRVDTWSDVPTIEKR